MGEVKTYAEWDPPAALAADVRCVWWSSFGSTAPILPDGHLDLIVDGSRVFVAGPDTVTTYSDSPAGQVIHGIRFRTGRAHRVLGVPADQLRDQRVDLAELWGAAGRRVAEQLIEAPERLVSAVAVRLADRPPDPVPEVDATVRALVAHRPRVAALHSEVGLSERQLRRRFTAMVGYGPATFLRIVRLQRALGIARANPGTGLAAIAYAAGYADQSHLSREVRKLSGMTAGALLGGRSVQESRRSQT